MPYRVVRSAVSGSLAALGFAALLASPASAQQRGCQAALCQADTLDDYFDKLVEAAQHKPGSRPVHILQIGDSHTAGDAITGGWRDLLQARYGSGGRGVLPPGRPYQGFLTYGANVTMSPGWVVKSTFGKDSVGARPPLGLAGFNLTSQVDNATLGFTADSGEAFDRFVVCALASPGAGTLSIQVGFTNIDFDLSSFAPRTECKTIKTPDIQYTARVVAHGGPVTITSWASFRDAGGVTLSNVGVVGSQFVHFGRTDDAVIQEELRAYRPDLIVIAFGTNEGFAPRIDPGEYEIVLRAQLGRIRRLAGNVPILMLGAPDANTRNTALSANAPGALIDCNAVSAAQPVPSPARQQTLQDIMASLRTSPETAQDPASAPVVAQPPAPTKPLFVPPGLGVVREVQRKVAASLNIAFWDWQARMGGACSAAGFVRSPIPMMRGDFVHFTKAGGWEIARKLQADLAAAQSAEAAR